MEKPNIIMILLDGLRADRISLCPHLSKILRQGYFFPNMITAAPYTLASLHSVFSGLYPTKNGVDSYFNMLKFKKEMCKTLAQYLHENGYCAYADVLNGSLIPHQGFDDVSAHKEYEDDLAKLHKGILNKISNRKNFFLFLQYSHLHAQGVKNVAKKYTDFDEQYFKNYESNKNNYNSYLKDMDFYIKDVFDRIKNSGLLENTILIILSDHGTSNGEKIGEKIYGSFTYDYTIKVFCSFIIPHKKGKEIGFQARTIDIMPTILDILKIGADGSYEHLQGSSLIPLMEGKEKQDRVAFSETGGLNGPWPSHNEHNVFCIRLKDRKLIYNKTPKTWEMYDLKQDPGENNNIFHEGNKIALKLKKMLLGHMASNRASNI